MPRFAAWYRLTGSEAEARAKAEDLCFEQTVEFPPSLVPAGFIRDEVVGRVERFDRASGGLLARISFLDETAGGELTQLLNVLYGNISLKKGFRLEALDGDSSLLGAFAGPRFGPEGLRALLQRPARPLLATAIKPMGLSAKELASQAFLFAAGGIDIVKDDHGLANQPFAAFAERVELCADAVQRGSAEAGRPILYAANVTASHGEILSRARYARARGAGALLISPGLTGFDAMRAIAEDDAIGLPILAHPAFLGSYVASPEDGLSHRVLFGQLMRLAGADAVIYPHAGGRFGFSLDECSAIVDGATSHLAGRRAALPAPAGGMSLKRIPELRAFYGEDAIFLIGGDLVKCGPDVRANCRAFRALVDG